MRKPMTIVPVTLGFGTVLQIPESWTVFTYRGFVYRRDDAGRCVRMAKVA